MELTFEQQVIVAVIGGFVASVLTSILNNWWTDRRLRDQWEREKEERQEQWRREQETRRREWKREYRGGLLRPYLEKVNRIVGISRLIPIIIDARAYEKRLEQLAEEVIGGVVGIEDKTFVQLQLEFLDAIRRQIRYMKARQEEPEAADVHDAEVHMMAAAGQLHKRAEELLEQTFD
jgi:hypothetical protein